MLDVKRPDLSTTLSQREKKKKLPRTKKDSVPGSFMCWERQTRDAQDRWTCLGDWYGLWRPVSFLEERWEEERGKRDSFDETYRLKIEMVSV